MNPFLYFFTGGILLSWIIALFFVFFGSIFANSGCLECTSGWIFTNCTVIPESTFQCQVRGTLELWDQGTAYMKGSGIEGYIVIAFVFGRDGIILGVTGWIIFRVCTFIKSKITRKKRAR